MATPARLRVSAPSADDTAGANAILPARTILVAAGTQPNTVLGREDPHDDPLDGKYFQAFDEDGAPVTPERVDQAGSVDVLMIVAPDGRAISFFGDLHPSFAGNVVKAMASAKQGYPVVTAHAGATAAAAEVTTGGAVRPARRRAARHACMRSIRLTPNIVEVVVRAPAAARAFKPGQFYRLQNFETLARSGRRHAPGDGGPGAHRRLGRPRRRPALDHRAGDGRLVGPMRAAAARRAGGADGADRHADRDPRRRDRAADRRRARQRRAVLDRPGVSRAGCGSSTSPATSARSTATRSPRSSARPTRSSGAATRRRVSRPTGRRTAPSSATSSRRSTPTDRGALGEPPIPLPDADRIIAIGSDGMMAAVAQRASRRAGALSEANHRPSARSTRRCSA